MNALEIADEEEMEIHHLFSFKNKLKYLRFFSTNYVFASPCLDSLAINMEKLLFTPMKRRKT